MEVVAYSQVGTYRSTPSLVSISEFLCGSAFFPGSHECVSNQSDLGLSSHVRKYRSPPDEAKANVQYSFFGVN